MKTHMKMSTLTLIALTVAALVLVGCGGGGSSAPTAERLRVDVTTPTARGAMTEGSIVLTGVVSQPTARVTVNDAAVSVGADGAFNQEVALEYGTNRFVIRADAEGFVAASRTVTFNRALTLEVTSPSAESEVSQNRLTVTGTVSDPAADVAITGVTVPVAADGSFSHTVTLHYPLNILNVTVGVAGVAPISQNLTVRLTSAR